MATRDLFLTGIRVAGGGENAVLGGFIIRGGVVDAGPCKVVIPARLIWGLPLQKGTEGKYYKTLNALIHRLGCLISFFHP